MSTLAEVNKNLESQRKDVSGIKRHIEQIMLLQERSRLDELEDRRERKKITTKAARDGKDGSSGAGFPLIPALPGLPALAALAASLADWDAYLKGLGIVDKFKQIKPTLKAFGDFIDDFGKGITNFADDIKLRWMLASDALTNLIKRIENLFSDIKLPRIKFILPEGGLLIRIPEVPISRWVNKAGEFIDNIKLKIPELPRLGFIDAAGQAIDNIKFKIPNVPAVKWASDAIDQAGNLVAKLPTIPTNLFDDISVGITRVVDTVKPFVNVVTEIIGTGSGIVGDIASASGKGLMGVFSVVGSAFETLKKIPFLGTIVKTLVRPFTQFLLSAFDFVTGFVDGFKSVPNIVNPETGEITVDLKAKLLAGMDKGIENVIRGIIEGIDFVFLKIPGWILEKLGVPNPLDDINLTQFTEPIWNGIKNTFRFVFDSEYRNTQIEAFKAEFDILGMVRNFFQSMKDSVASFFGMDANNQSRLALEEEAGAISQTLSALEAGGITETSRGKEGNRYRQLQERLEEINEMLSSESYYQGTKGFKNFGSGTAAMLHGSEAVVPERSAAGNILKSVNTQRVSNALTELASQNSAVRMGMQPIIIQDNSSNVSSSGSATISLDNNPSSVDMSYQMRRQSLVR